MDDVLMVLTFGAIGCLFGLVLAAVGPGVRRLLFLLLLFGFFFGGDDCD